MSFTTCTEDSFGFKDFGLICPLRHYDEPDDELEILRYSRC